MLHLCYSVGAEKRHLSVSKLKMSAETKATRKRKLDQTDELNLEPPKLKKPPQPNNTSEALKCNDDDEKTKSPKPKEGETEIKKQKDEDKEKKKKKTKKKKSKKKLHQRWMNHPLRTPIVKYYYINLGKTY